jgi:hypothetical protein
MPPVYAVISFFSYRYFRSYTYYELIEVGKPSQQAPSFVDLTHLILLAYEVTTCYVHRLLFPCLTNSCSGCHLERLPVCRFILIG